MKTFLNFRIFWCSKLMHLSFTLLALFLLTFISYSQESENLYEHDTSRPILSQKDIDKFIKTVKPMFKEIEALGLEEEEEFSENYDENEDDLDAFYEIFDYEEVREILNNYGWDNEDFGAKYISIVWGTSYFLTLEQIEAIPKEEKERTAPFMEAMIEQYKSMVNETDLTLIKNNYSPLKKVIKSFEEEMEFEEDY